MNRQISKFNTKHVAISFLIGVVIIGGALFINRYTNQNHSFTQQNATTTTIIATSTNTLKLPTAAPKDKPLDEMVEGDKTKTDILAEKTIGQYLKLRRDNKYNTKTKNKILNQATDELLSINFTPLTKAGISAKDTSTTQDAQTYKNEMYLAIAPLFKLDEYELTIYARAIQDNNAEDFNKLASVAQIYNDVAKNVKKIHPPKDALNVHLDIINSLERFATVLYQLSKGYDDPAASLSGTANFTKAETQFKTAFSKLDTYFILKNVNKYE